MKCDQCLAVMVNGVLCHEHGCPNIRMYDLPKCEKCGHQFKPLEPTFEDLREGGKVCRECLPDEDYEAHRKRLQWD